MLTVRSTLLQLFIGSQFRQRKKFNLGTCLLYLEMEVRFSHDGILFVISENRRNKYVEILQKYLDRNQLLRPQASQLAGRLS